MMGVFGELQLKEVHMEMVEQTFQQNANIPSSSSFSQGVDPFWMVMRVDAEQRSAKFQSLTGG